MGKKIRVEMNDWLFNAGVVGLYNILKHSGDIIEVGEQYIEFDSDLLGNFQEKYFEYFINKYEKYLSWFKIISYKITIDYHKNNEFKSFKENDLELLNKYIKDVVKKYLKSNSYKAAYELINDNTDILAIEKDLGTIRLSKKDNIADKLPEVKNVYIQLERIINYCNKSDSKKYLAGKNIVYTIIRNAWDGVCFLNPQTKEKDMYIDYWEHFVKPVEDYNNVEKTKYIYNCFICNREMSNLNNDLSFLNNVGFDVSRKSSHVWNFNNDIAVCPICKLVYSCIPAGITYVYNKGIYINDNYSFDRLTNINNKLKDEILKEYEMNSMLTYAALVNSIQEQLNDKIKYELADIQVIRYERERYKFNILSKQMLNIISKSKEDLNKIMKSGFIEINTYFNIYELVIDRILNNQNLFTLIYKLLVYKLTNPKNCRFNISQVIKVLSINFRIMEGMGYMGNTHKDIIKNANISGYYLREKYKGKGAKDKLNGISYRLLNALKINNKDMFMDTLLNCYLYAQKTVPAIFLEGLKDDESFKTIGYAFVSGLIEGKENPNKNGGE